MHIVGHDWGAALAYILGARGGPLEGRVASMVTMAVPHNAVHGILQHPWQVRLAVCVFLLFVCAR